LADTLTAVPRLIAAGDVRTIVVRGPHHNGRRTILGAVARASGRGVLDVSALDRADSRIDHNRWREVALLATAMRAMPVLACEPGPGECVEIQRPDWFDGPIGIAIGRSGGISGSATERAITVTLGMPGFSERRTCWRRALGTERGDRGDIDAISERFRLPSGHIMRAAALVRANAALASRVRVTLDDVRDAARLLNAQALDALASRIPCTGDWTDLAAREDTMRELLDLELRCRQRERLPPALARGGDRPVVCGVRALFRGPSGTGKTLAARLLASVLQKDLYRVDLSSIVNKYIGETEKNLDRVISRAEELDVILLFDEGDALLTQRTSVSSANDRYANLETNYLLQRLEAFDGILIVTTNAGERIDAAFERRMDVVVEFQPAQAAERWALWQLHLPPTHAVAPDFLDELASRCVLNGGQIRNAVQQAVLQAMPRRGVVDAVLLEAAVRREYRKAGAVCPLRSVAPAYSA
jgi:ATPase family protein associated with various cellular activities (AAA)